MTNRMPSTTRLRDRTISLYNQQLNTNTRDEIAADTGLSRTWLFAFGMGQIAAPSVNNVECLYCYLTGRDLEL